MSSDAVNANISPEFPYKHRFVPIKGNKIAYVDEGEGPIVLFVHGNATSSYLWRNIIPFVQKGYRAIALDLIGMGKSDKPDIDYTFQDHYDYLEGFIDVLGLRDLILVLHDWGGGLGAYYASKHSGNVRAVAMMEAAVPPTLPYINWSDFGGEDAVAFFKSFRDPETGPKLLIEDNMFVEAVLPNSVIRTLSDAEMAVYRAPYPTPETRKPLYVWPNEIPIEGTPARNVAVMEDIASWMASSDQPKLYLYASPGLIITPDTAHKVAELMKNVQTRFIGEGIHYLQEDHPEVIGRNIADWLRENLA